MRWVFLIRYRNIQNVMMLVELAGYIVLYMKCKKGEGGGLRRTRAVWLLPSIMAIWFANGPKRRPESCSYLQFSSILQAGGENTSPIPFLHQFLLVSLPTSSVSHIEILWVNICLRSRKLILFKSKNTHEEIAKNDNTTLRENMWWRFIWEKLSSVFNCMIYFLFQLRWLQWKNYRLYWYIKFLSQQ